MMCVARYVNELPNAVWYFSAMPIELYVLVMAAGIWWCLWSRSYIRWAGVFIFVAGIFFAQTLSKPVVMVNKTATVYGINSTDGVIITG